MFRRRSGQPDITVYVDDAPCPAVAGDSVSSLLLTSGNVAHRCAVVGGAPRGAYCMMGVCFECLVEVDGQPYQRGCMTPMAQGMRIRRQTIRQDEPWY